MSKDLGKVGLLNRGDYSASATYNAADFVYYDTTGSSYVCLRDNTTGVTPSNDGTYWKYLSKGSAFGLIANLLTTQTGVGALDAAMGPEITGQIDDLRDDVDDIVDTKLNGLRFGIENGVYGYYKQDDTFVGFRRPTGNAAAGDVLSGKTFANASSDTVTGSMANNGAVSQALDCGDDYTIPAGYHNGSGVITANSLASQTGVDSGKTAAAAAQILTGYQAWVNGVKVSGNMANNGAVSPSALNCGDDYTIPAGYHNGSGVVTAASLASQTGVDDGKTAATAATIRSGYQAWVNGSKVSGSMATLTDANFAGTHSSTTAGAASNYVVKSSSAGYVASGTTVDSLAAGTSPTIATTAATGTKTINVKPGYYNKISVNQTLAYNAGRTVGLSLSYYSRGGTGTWQSGKSITVPSNCLLFFVWNNGDQQLDNGSALWYKHGTTLKQIWTNYDTSDRDSGNYLVLQYSSDTVIKAVTGSNGNNYWVFKLS